ncbi:class I SAM-dependent DNA methyltransferase [Streptomyces sp. NPDC088197]|uniref:class I SAM-dependent DNA methyltransferase n=1 Tax=unclassified Streptomyces TaxID=2593676 RepID=UPI0036E4950D
MTESTDLTDIRAAYDTVADSYADLLRDALAAGVLDRATLGAFAELAQRGRPVADIGCGPGRITGYLAELGLDVFGVDLSPEMVAVARRDLPRLRFDVGSMTDLDLPDGSLGGLVAWYSIIHLPPRLLPRVFAEFHRVLAPGAPLAVAYKIGDTRHHLSHGYGHPISLDVYWHPPARITALAESAGLTVTATTTRAPAPDERQPQGYLLAARPV